MDSSVFLIILFGVFMIIFAATAAIALLGVIKKVNIDDKYLKTPLSSGAPGSGWRSDCAILECELLRDECP